VFESLSGLLELNRVFVLCTDNLSLAALQLFPRRSCRSPDTTRHHASVQAMQTTRRRGEPMLELDAKAMHRSMVQPRCGGADGHELAAGMDA
jgi:hypothetical protein